jgi:hypothetical protein
VTVFPTIFVLQYAIQLAKFVDIEKKQITEEQK